MSTAASPSSLFARFAGSLYWKISGTLLLLLALLAGIYVYVTADAANRYFEATHQRLNKDVAERIAEFTLPFIKRQEVNEREAGRLFFNAMVLNPSIEVYLLDPQGNVLLCSSPEPPYCLPKSALTRQRVALEPVRRFIATHGTEYIAGDDPKNPAERKIFSAAKVERYGQLLGYVYVVLASKTYDSTMAQLLHSYVGRLATTTGPITLLAAFAIGLLAFYVITRRLRQLVEAVREFRRGNLAARAQVRGTDELAQLAATFNRMADTLAANLRTLQTAEQLRRDLVANVSHDLRTPVAAIRGYAETLVLKNGGLAPADQRRYLGILLQHAEKLDTQVSELFELSKLEAADAAPHLEPFVLAELVQEVFQKYHILAEQKGIDFRCTPGGAARLVVSADIGLLERALQNLVDNAIKHTAPGGWVQLDVRKAGAAAEMVVANAGGAQPGPGLDYLLSPDAGASLSRPAGVGLGLIIVRKILRLHGTALAVEQRPDGSIRAAFCLPRQQVAQGAAAAPVDAHF